MSLDTTNQSMANYLKNQQEVKERKDTKRLNERRMSAKMYWDNNRHSISKASVKKSLT